MGSRASRAAPGIVAGHGCLLRGAETCQPCGTSCGAGAVDALVILLLLLLLLDGVFRRLPQQRVRTNPRRRIDALCAHQNRAMLRLNSTWHPAASDGNGDATETDSDDHACSPLHDRINLMLHSTDASMRCADGISRRDKCIEAAHVATRRRRPSSTTPLVAPPASDRSCRCPRVHSHPVRPPQRPAQPHPQAQPYRPPPQRGRSSATAARAPRR